MIKVELHVCRLLLRVVKNYTGNNVCFSFSRQEETDTAAACLHMSVQRLWHKTEGWGKTPVHPYSLHSRDYGLMSYINRRVHPREVICAAGWRRQRKLWPSSRTWSINWRRRWSNRKARWKLSLSSLLRWSYTADVAYVAAHLVAPSELCAAGSALGMRPVCYCLSWQYYRCWYTPSIMHSQSFLGNFLVEWKLLFSCACFNAALH